MTDNNPHPLHSFNQDSVDRIEPAWVRLTQYVKHTSIDAIIAEANRVDALEKEQNTRHESCDC